MSIFTYEASELFQWLVERAEMTILDVRNPKDFERFQVESPYPFDLRNVSYYDFMEIEAECMAKIPKGKPLRIVCAQEGSAKYVAEIFDRHGYDDVGYLNGGIKTWGNLLVPQLVNPGADYELYQFIRPGKASCSYGLVYKGEMMLFDPSRNVDFYLRFADDKGVQIVKTFETHLQADYIAGSRLIAARTGARFFANENDFKGSKIDYYAVSDGQLEGFSAGGPVVRVAFTPGHTPGSTSYVIDESYMISGDMVFINSVGRPDLGGKAVEWAGILFKSIGKIKAMDPAMLILPGHYINWSEADGDLLFMDRLDNILKKNKGIYSITTLDGFITFIKDNMRPQPAEYATIRLVNANLKEVDDKRAEELDLGKNECAASAYAKAKAEAGEVVTYTP